MTLIFNSAKPYITSSSVSSPSLSTKGWWSWNLLWKARVMDDYREDNSKMKKKCRVKLRSNAVYYSNSEKKKNLTLTSRSLINVAILFVSITLFDRSSLVKSNCFLQYSSLPCSKHLSCSCQKCVLDWQATYNLQILAHKIQALHLY